MSAWNTPSAASALPAASTHDNVVEALQLTAAALQTVTAAVIGDEGLNIRFTGVWQHFGTQTIGQVLDRANAALEPYSTERQGAG